MDSTSFPAPTSRPSTGGAPDEWDEQRYVVAYAVTKVLAESATVADAVPRLLSSVGQALGWEVGSIWLVDDEEDGLRCAAVWSVPNVDVARFEEVCSEMLLPAGIELPGRVLKTGGPVWIGELNEETSVLRGEVASGIGLRTAFGVPIRWGGEVFGAMEFFSRLGMDEDEETLRLMTAAGTEIGQFMARRLEDDEHRSRAARASSVLDTTPDPLVVFDHRGIVVEFNRAAGRLLGHVREEALGLEVDELVFPPAWRARFDAELALYLSTGEGEQFGRRRRMNAMRGDGSEFAVEVEMAPVESTRGTLFVLSIHEASAVAAGGADHSRTWRDRLTGLPSQAALEQVLELGLARARRRPEVAVAALHVDVDGFGEVNVRHGRAVGDGLLRQIGLRLSSVCRATDVLGRLADDSFGLVLSDVQGSTNPAAPDQVDNALLVAEVVAARLHEAVKAPFHVASTELRPTISIGVSVYPLHAKDGRTMLDTARVAMERSRAGGPGGHAVSVWQSPERLEPMPEALRRGPT